MEGSKIVSTYLVIILLQFLLSFSRFVNNVFVYFSYGLHGPVLPMDDYPIHELIHETKVIFVCSTTGQGDDPDNMKKFWKFLLKRSLPSNSLNKMK